MNVFIADNSKVIQERLIDILSEFKEIKIIGQSQNITEAVESIQRLKPDIVIMDVHMPKGSGIEALQTIKKRNLASIVIMFTYDYYSQYRKRCMEAGADFFFDKSNEFEEIGKLFKKLINDSYEHHDSKKKIISNQAD